MVYLPTFTYIFIVTGYIPIIATKTFQESQLSDQNLGFGDEILSRFYRDYCIYIYKGFCQNLYIVPINIYILLYILYIYYYIYYIYIYIIYIYISTIQFL